MIPNVDIDELWAIKVNGSDLYDIERPVGVGPKGGGGQSFIQVAKGAVPQLLRFLRAPYPPNGQPIELPVASVGRPGHVDIVQFASKSQGRMRIPNQNRHRAERVHAWSPANGFPSLPADAVSTEHANELINRLGGLHIYLIRAADGVVWAGFTTGTLDDQGGALPFAYMLSGSHPGGYWRYEGTADDDAHGE